MCKNLYKFIIMDVYSHTHSAGLILRFILIVIQHFLWAGLLPEAYTKAWDSAKTFPDFSAFPEIGRRNIALMSHLTKKNQ